MSVEIPATLAPRAPAGMRSMRTHETLVPAGVRVRETLVPAGIGGPRPREVLLPAGLAARAREALTNSARARQALAAAGVERARAREASLRRQFQFALNAQLTHSIFSGNQIHLRYKWMDGRLVGAWPTPRWEWVPSDRDAARARFSPELRDPLQLPAFEQPPRYQPPTPPNNHFTHMDIHNAVAGGARTGIGGFGGASGASSGSSGTSGAVGAGAAILALAALVLLARALERCLDQRIFKLLRRRSDEWFTPNVLATSHQVRDDGTMEGADLDSPNVPPGDPPPPYSMCLPKSPQAPSVAEPPPPYSACYVAFGGPQDPVPRVYLNGPSLTSFQDTGQLVTDQNRQSQVSEDAEMATGRTRVDDRCSDTSLAEWRSSRTATSEPAAVVPNISVA